MTLDPVHVEEIGSLAREIGRDVDDADHDDLADRVWNEFLDPLRVDGAVVLEPIEDCRRSLVEIDGVALLDRPYPTVHGLDSGTMNPTTFVNGAVVDVAHAALARDPSDHELHRKRSIVGTIHRYDASGVIPGTWESFDDEYARRRWLRTPRVERFAEGVVHAMALGAAEIAHARDNMESIDDVLLLDGPIYPKELLRWRDRHPALRELLLSEPSVRELLADAVGLVDTALSREVDLAGFVKNPASNRLTRSIRSAGGPAPWFNDAGFFRRVLDPSGVIDDPTSRIAYTNWFVSRAGTDGAIARGEPIDVRGKHEEHTYELTFMAIYDPRDEVVYHVEAPRGMTQEEAKRDRIRDLALRSVAANRGPPTAIAKADQLARIDRGQKRTVRRVIERSWETEVAATYDDLRWGME